MALGHHRHPPGAVVPDVAADVDVNAPSSHAKNVARFPSDDKPMTDDGWVTDTLCIRHPLFPFYFMGLSQRVTDDW